MGQALYRKYRSKSLSEIVGQEHITTALEHALKQGRISHAYLFTGPRGVGKTSIARILAYEVNGLPYDELATHMDIIEIDAASNRRIDEIRELRERVHSAPASAKYKVYIIDEVHMLTKEAFNALLKTLEEPPAHAIFILATTESHKLPETIISRTQRYNFRPVEHQQVIDHLAYIAKQENIAIDTDALALIAEHGGGSFRDSISLLDQVGNTSDKISLSDVQGMLGIAPEQMIEQLMEVLKSGMVADVVNIISQVRDQGYQPSQLAKQLAAHLRQGLITGQTSLPPVSTTNLLRGLLAIPASHDPVAFFELLLIDQVIDKTPVDIPSIEPSKTTKTTKPVAVSIDEPIPKAKAEAETLIVPKKALKQEAPEISKSEKSSPVTTEPTKNSPIHSLNEATWALVLNEIKSTHNTLYSIARMAQPSFEGSTLTLGFDFPFHQKRINESKNKQIFSDIILQLTGENIAIACVKSQKLAKHSSAPVTLEPSTKSAIDNISNIFGEAEILE